MALCKTNAAVANHLTTYLERFLKRFSFPLLPQLSYFFFSSVTIEQKDASFISYPQLQ